MLEDSYINEDTTKNCNIWNYCSGWWNFYGIINNAEDVLIMSLIFLFVTCIPLFDKKKSK